MDSEKMVETNRKARMQMVGIFAIAMVTLGGSYLLFYLYQDADVWGTVNKGSFVEPAMTVAELGLQDSEGTVLMEGGTWWLWVVAPQQCLDDCEHALFQMRQLHVLLNKDSPRVRRALVTESIDTTSYTQEYVRLQVFRGDLGELSEGIYIVDPIGNLVFYYPLEDAGKPVLDDLKRLLKLSQIG